ncbi:MAG: hypothetical protein JNK82_39320 [Myxococcaceae bacterium]|nr:hypothetical protein [Myxococcaceae bacterium]
MGWLLRTVWLSAGVGGTVWLAMHGHTLGAVMAGFWSLVSTLVIFDSEAAAKRRKQLGVSFSAKQSHGQIDFVVHLVPGENVDVESVSVDLGCGVHEAVSDMYAKFVPHGSTSVALLAKPARLGHGERFDRNASIALAPLIPKEQGDDLVWYATLIVKLRDGSVHTESVDPLRVDMEAARAAAAAAAAVPELTAESDAVATPTREPVRRG